MSRFRIFGAVVAAAIAATTSLSAETVDGPVAAGITTAHAAALLDNGKAPTGSVEAPSSNVTEITIVLAGDTGFNGSMQPARSDGALRHRQRIPFADLTAGVAPLINGDVNFANLETVVTDRNDIPAVPKAFNFRSHPSGVAHLVNDLGFNLISTANNHSMDFGTQGVRETLRHTEHLQTGRAVAFAGVGANREIAGRPAALAIKDSRILFSAIGIGADALPTSLSRADRPGQLAYRSPEDFSGVIEGLKAASGDYRILSVHYGTELSVTPSLADVRKLRQAVKSGGADLVAGHHAHVVAGIEQIDGKLIFYGLGNFLHPGMQDMAKFGMCRDYGLLARVHLVRAPGGVFEAKAVEVQPLTDMNARSRPMAAGAARDRVYVLNHLAQQFDDPREGAQGVRFTPQLDGSGLYCAPGAETAGGKIGALCRSWQEPAPAPEQLARRIANACGISNAVASNNSSNSSNSSRGRVRERVARGKTRLANTSASPWFFGFGN